MILKVSTARSVVVFMADSTDGITGKTGLTLTITASKDGGAFASISPTVTELTNGYYKLALTSSHTDTKGQLEIYCTGTGAIASVNTHEVCTDLPGDTVSLSASNQASVVDDIWDEVLTAATHNVATSAGKRLRQLSTISQTDSSVNDAAATTTSFITALTSSVDNFYRDQLIVFTSGALSGQTRPIYSYNGTTKTIVVDEAWTSAPANADTFTLVSFHEHTVTSIVTAIWAALTSALTTAGTVGKLIVDYLNASVSAIKAKTDNLPSNPASMDFKKNTAFTAFTFILTDSTTHLPASGLTVTATRSLDGAAFAACANSVSEISDGAYKINLAAADLNADILMLKFTAPGADTQFFTIRTDS